MIEPTTISFPAVNGNKYGTPGNNASRIMFIVLRVSLSSLATKDSLV